MDAKSEDYEIEFFAKKPPEGHNIKTELSLFEYLVVLLIELKSKIPAGFLKNDWKGSLWQKVMLL